MKQLLNFLNKYKTTLILAIFGLADILSGFTQDIITGFNLSEKGALIFKIVMAFILYYRLRIESAKNNNKQTPNPA